MLLISRMTSHLRETFTSLRQGTKRTGNHTPASQLMFGPLPFFEQLEPRLMLSTNPTVTMDDREQSSMATSVSAEFSEDVSASSLNVAENLYFEAEDLSLVEKMYVGDMWPIIGNAIYIHPTWGRMPLRYTLSAVPDKAYDVVFYTSNNDPGVGNLDISWDDGLTWDTTSYRNVTGEKTVMENVIADSNGDISFIIAHVLGVNSSLDYIKLEDLTPSVPGPVDALAYWMSSQGTQPTAQEIIQQLADYPDSFNVLWRQEGTSLWTGQTSDWVLDTQTGVLNAVVQGDTLYSISISASDYQGAVRLNVEATTLEARANPQELMLTSEFNPANWQRQFYPQLPYLDIESDVRTTVKFLENGVEDVTSASSKAFYPFGVLEKTEGFLFWGAMDVGKFRVLTPNMIPNSIPSFNYKPSSLQIGETFTFDITLKWFAKPESKYRDVLRWYLMSIENSDPVTSSWVGQWDGEPFVRPLEEGNLTPGGIPGAVPTEAAKQDMLSRYIGNIWFMYFRPSDAPASVDATWKNMWWRDATRDDMLMQMDWLKDNGFHPFLYLNQFLGSDEDLVNSPFLNDWIARDKDGNPYPPYAFHGCEGPVDPRMYYFADFGNDAYRAWYINKVKEAVDFYRPEGLAWDCGFGHYHAGYSYSNPDTTNGHGILQVQAELWQWIHETYPDMRVIVNECTGSFTQLVTDAVIIENSYGGGKGELDFEAAKATGATVIAGEYFRDGAFQFQGIPTAEYPYLAMRYRAEGLDTQTQSTVVSVGAEPWTAPLTAINGSDLQTDGQWHTVIVNLQNRAPSLSEVQTLNINVSPTQATEAYLEVEYLRFTSDAGGTAVADTRDQTNPLSYQSFLPLELDTSHFDFWTPTPVAIWPPSDIASDYSEQITNDAIEFFVSGENKRMVWRTLPPKFTGNLMRVMSYGASLGFGDTQYWPDLNEFSGKAMGLPLVVGSHDVEVSVPQGAEEEITASAWAGSGNGQLMLAAYNSGEQDTLSTITVVPQVLQSAGVQQIDSSNIRILGGNGSPLEGQSAVVQLTPEGGLQVDVTLESGHALLLELEDATPGSDPTAAHYTFKETAPGNWEVSIGVSGDDTGGLSAYEVWVDIDPLLVSYEENVLATVVGPSYTPVGFLSSTQVQGDVGGNFNAGNYQGSGDAAILGVSMVPVYEPGSIPGTTPLVDLDVPALLGILSTPAGLTATDFRVQAAGLLNATGDGFLNTDSLIPTGEVIQWLEGDANTDGVVSAGDYASVQTNFGSAGIGCVDGDANGDGVVSAGDYAAVQTNFGATAVSSMITPPAGMMPAGMMSISGESLNSTPIEEPATTVAVIPTIVAQTARRVPFVEPVTIAAIETTPSLTIEPMSIEAPSYEFSKLIPIDSFYSDRVALWSPVSEWKTESPNQKLRSYESAADIFPSLDILESVLIDII